MTLPLPVQQCRGQIPTPTCPQSPGGRRCTHPSGGLCGQCGPNAVAAVGSQVGSFLLPAGGGVCGQGSREGGTASARWACTRDDLPGLPTEPSVKSPGLQAMGRARTWGRRGWLSNPSRWPSGAGVRDPGCGLGSSTLPLIPGAPLWVLFCLRLPGAASTAPIGAFLSEVLEHLPGLPACQHGFHSLTEQRTFCGPIRPSRQCWGMNILSGRANMPGCICSWGMTGRKRELIPRLCINHFRSCCKGRWGHLGATVGAGPQHVTYPKGLQPLRSGRATRERGRRLGGQCPHPSWGALHSPSFPGGYGHCCAGGVDSAAGSASSETTCTES